MYRVFSTLLIVFLVFSGPAVGEEAPADLGSLFERLDRAQSPSEAAPIEEAIWNVWVYAGDTDADELMDRGIVAMEAGALALAAKIFTTVVANAPDLSEGWNKRATVYYLMGNLEASMLDIQRVLALEPRHFGALSGLGLIYIETGQDLAALKAFDRALEIHPQMSSVKARERALRDRLKGSEI